MSRSGYTDDCYDDLAVGRWRAIIASATRGKRGQAFFRDLIQALDEMPVKRLITGNLIKDGEVCAIGSLGVKRSVQMEHIDPDDAETVGSTFDIAPQLAQEVVYMNDEFLEARTPEERWTYMRGWAERQLKKSAK